MKLFKIRKVWFCFAWLPLYFDSESSSDNSEKVTNETQDNRIAAATDSTNLSLSRATTTDHGATDSSFHFATDMAKGAFNTNNHAIDAIADTSNKSLDAVASAYQDSSDTVAKAYANDNAGLADAYKTAKAGEKRFYSVLRSAWSRWPQSKLERNNAATLFCQTVQAGMPLRLPYRKTLFAEIGRHRAPGRYRTRLSRSNLQPDARHDGRI